MRARAGTEAAEVVRTSGAIRHRILGRLQMESAVRFGWQYRGRPPIVGLSSGPTSGMFFMLLYLVGRASSQPIACEWSGRVSHG